MNPYSKALRDLDRGLSSQLGRLTKAINASCEKVELRLMRVCSCLLLLYIILYIVYLLWFNVYFLFYTLLMIYIYRWKIL